MFEADFQVDSSKWSCSDCFYPSLMSSFTAVLSHPSKKKCGWATESKIEIIVKSAYFGHKACYSVWICYDVDKCDFRYSYTKNEYLNL